MPDARHQKTRRPVIYKQLAALFTLTLAGEPLVAPVFARTDALSSLMRPKLIQRWHR
jgi:hypothetical protein